MRGAKDYLLAIYTLQRSYKVARVRDVANYLGLTKAAVTITVKGLVRRGLVKHERYGYIELTPQGESLAVPLYTSAQKLAAIFRELGMSSVTAESMAECVVVRASDNVLSQFLAALEAFKKGVDGSG